MLLKLQPSIIQKTLKAVQGFAKKTQLTKLKKEDLSRHDYRYSFEQETQFKDKTSHLDYGQYRTEYQIAAEKEKQLKDFSKQFIKQTENTLLNKVSEEAELIEKDELWGDSPFPTRFIDSNYRKEKYWISRDTKFIQNSNRKIGYLGLFQTSNFDSLFDQIIKENCAKIYEFLTKPEIQSSIADPDFQIEAQYKQNPEICDAFAKIIDHLKVVNPKVYPQTIYAVGFLLRYKEDCFQLWQSLLEKTLKNLHIYTKQELFLIKQGLNGVFPKVQNCLELNYAITDLILNEIHSYSVVDLTYAIHCTRNENNCEKFYKKVVKQLKKQLVAEQNFIEPHAWAHVFYTVMNCQIPEFKQRKFRLPDQNIVEAEQLFTQFSSQFIDNIFEMNTDSLILLASAIQLSRSTNQMGLLHKIERQFVKRAEQLDEFQLSQIIYIFGKVNQGAGFGNSQFYTALLPKVCQSWEKFSVCEKSRITFTYCSLDQCPQETWKKVFLPFINKNILRLQYNDLQNIVYSLLFQQVSDPEVWKQYMHNLAYQKHIIPVSNYACFKLAYFYLSNAFPQWNLEPFLNSSYKAEEIVNTVRSRQGYQTEVWKEFAVILKEQLKIKFESLVEWENTLIIPYAILPEQVAIFVVDEGEKLTDLSERLRPAFKLRLRLLEMNSWSVVLCDWSDFKSKPQEVRMAELKEKIEKAYKKQSTWLKTVKLPQDEEDFRVFQGAQVLGLFGQPDQEILLQEVEHQPPEQQKST